MTPLPIIFRQLHLVGCVVAPTLLLMATTLAAVPDPAFFSANDIGSPSVAGSTAAIGASLNLTAAGQGIGFRSDQFHFAATNWPGDFDLKFRVAALDAVDLWSKAGLMVRRDLVPGSPFAAVFTTPSGVGSLFQSRAAEGAAAANAGFFPANLPLAWLRLKRSGNQFTGFAGYDGLRWSLLGTATVDVGADAWLGFAVASHHTNQVTRAEFTSLADASADSVASLAADREPIGPSTRRTALAFTEIMYHPADRTDGRELEFVELYNSQPYYEDISGFRIAGSVEYTFPVGTLIPGGGFLVIAVSPADVKAVYGLGKVMGPLNGKLPGSSGTLRLLNEQGAVYLDLDYRAGAPWPKAADGGGHSLVLARPSYGEASSDAWAASRLKGGSPGMPDAVDLSPLRAVRINEWVLPNGGVENAFIELRNGSSKEVDLAGARVTTDQALPGYTFPAGVRLAPGGLLKLPWTAVGLNLIIKGAALWLESPDRTWIIDAVDLALNRPGQSVGRWPDGSREIRALPIPTPGVPNVRPAAGVVINEIHFSAPNGDPREQFVELFNAGNTQVDLGGWRFTEGITFTFPMGTLLSPGGALVVVSDADYFRSQHPGLSANAVIGNFTGKLSGRGERLSLGQPYVVPAEKAGKTDTVFAEITAAKYADGGRWSRYADGGGSSLELLDPRSDPCLSANWADSDESTKAGWTLIETTGKLELGAGSPDSLHILLMGEGECLVDNVEVIGPSKTNVISNSTFESGLTGWVVQGNHINSSVESTEGYQSAQSLHIRASGNGDTGANRIRTRLSRPLKNGDDVTIRARVRWLKGWPEILFRIKGNYLEAYGRLQVPSVIGTPGSPNNRKVLNAGPAFAGVTHFPVVPAAGESVVVTARIDDPDGVASARLNYRIDPATVTVSVPLLDDGTGGDALAGDGMYSATIPGQDAGKLVAFTLEATDAAASTAGTVFPPGAPVREALVRFEEPTPSGAFGTYRLWLTQAAVKTWSSRPNLSNEPVDGTFVYGNWRVVYGAGGRFAGSPYHQQFSSPTSPCHYVIEMPNDDRVLGASAFNKIHAPGNGPFDDSTIQREQAAYWLARKSGLPWLYRRYVNVFVNGSKRSTLMEDTQVGSSDFVKSWWPDDPDGDLFKMQPWFEFDDGTSTSLGFQNNSWCNIQDYRGSDGARKVERFRWNWLPRGASGTANNYSNVFELVDAAGALSEPDYMTKLQLLVDTDNWLKFCAIHHALGNWDSVGYFNQQNTYSYKPDRGPWRLIMWDANIVFGNSGSHGPTGLPLFSTSDPVIGVWFSGIPSLARRYRQALLELVNGAFTTNQLGPLLDAKYQAFQEHGVNATTPGVIKSYINSARRDILGQITNGVPAFAVTDSSALAYDLSPAVATIIGTAPFEVVNFSLNGVRVAPLWLDQNQWLITTELPAGSDRLVVIGLDASGQAVPGARVERAIEFVRPKEHVVFAEIMYRPSVPKADYVELANNGTSAIVPMGGWRIEELDYTFDSNFLLGPWSTVAVARDLGVFQSAYNIRFGAVVGPTGRGLSPSGQTLRLTKPITGSTNRELVTAVAYSARSPWPALPKDGVALQLRDFTGGRDDRVGNWGFSAPAIPDTNKWKRLTVTGVATGTNLLLRVSSWPPVLDIHDAPGRWTAGNSADFASVLRLERRADGTQTAIMASGADDEGIPMELVSFTNGVVKFKYPGIDYKFSGRVNSAGDRLSGTYTYQGTPTGTLTYTRQNPGGTVVVDDVRLVAGSEPDAGPNLIADGGFEGDFAASWVASGSYSNSAPVAATPHSGLSSLRLTSSRGGDGTANAAVFQPVPGLGNGNLYTLTCWYSVDTKAEALVIGFDDYSLQAAADLIPRPLPHPEFSPGQANTVPPLRSPLPLVFLNEIQPRDPAWVELLNTGDQPISLTGMFLASGPNIDTPNRWDFPAGTLLAPQAFLLVGLGIEPTRSGLRADIKLEVPNGTVYLGRGADDALELVDALRYDAVAMGGSFGHGHDGNGWEDRTLAVATPAQSNRAARIAASLQSSTGSPLRLSWNAEPGRRYRLESSASLTTPNWQSLTVRTASAEGDFAEDSVPVGGTRYYRLVLLDP